MIDDWLPVGLKDEETIIVLNVWTHQYSVQCEVQPSILEKASLETIPPIKSKKKDSNKTVGTPSINSATITHQPSTSNVPLSSTTTILESYLRLHCCLVSDRKIDFILCVSLTTSDNESNQSLFFPLHPLNQ